MKSSSVTSAVIDLDPLTTKNRRRQGRRANERRKTTRFHARVDAQNARTQGATLYELIEKLTPGTLSPAQMHGRAKCARQDAAYIRRCLRDETDEIAKLDRRAEAREERIEDESVSAWTMTSDAREAELDAYVFGCMGNMQAACASDHQVLVRAQNGTFVLYPGGPMPHRVDEYATQFAREHTYCTPNAVTMNGQPLTSQEMDRILSYERPSRRLPGGPAGYPTKASVCFEGRSRGGTKRHDLAWKTTDGEFSTAR